MKDGKFRVASTFSKYPCNSTVSIGEAKIIIMMIRNLQAGTERLPEMRSISFSSKVKVSTVLRVSLLQQ